MSEEITEPKSSLENVFCQPFYNDKPLTYEKTPPDVDIKKSLHRFPCQPIFLEYHLRELIRYYLFLNRKKHREMLVNLAKMLFEAERENQN